MKKNLFLVVIGAIALVLTACSSKTKSPLAFMASATTSVEVNGESIDVDTFVVNHYMKTRVKEALLRDKAVRNVTRPTDASSFGKKKAEVHWRAFEGDLRGDKYFKEVGTVTVVHYEKGLEIIKDGQSWFYDGFQYVERNIWHISAASSILHRPQWEPVDVAFHSTDFGFIYLYPQGYDGMETFSATEDDREGMNIGKIGDLYADCPEPVKYY